MHSKSEKSLVPATLPLVTAYVALPLAAINPSDHSLAFADSGQNLHDIIYVNTGANETYIQALGSGKIRIKDNNGNDLASFDSSGNLRTKGTMTASTTP
jgi:hypothetical protein